MKTRFYGGSLDGQTKDIRGCFRLIQPVDSRTRETYVRDGDRHERTGHGELAGIAMKLEKTERCALEGSHEGSCDYREVTPT